jgi:hypothetical protein
VIANKCRRQRIDGARRQIIIKRQRSREQSEVVSLGFGLSCSLPTVHHHRHALLELVVEVVYEERTCKA